MRFETLEVSIEVVRSLRGPLKSLRTKNLNLFLQIRKATESIALNIAEGNRRTGKDRLHHFRIAAGSANEVRTALRIAVAWGEVEPVTIRNTLDLLDQVLAMLWRLSH